MKPTIGQVETFFIFLFFLVLPFEKRHIFFGLGYKYKDFSAVSLYVSDLIVLSLFLLFFLRKSFKFIPRDEKLYYPIIPLVCLIIIEALISPRDTFTYYSAIKWLELAFLFIYFSSTKNVARVMLKGITISGLLQALIAIGQFVKQGSLGLKILGETFITPNIAGIAKIDTASGKVIRAYGTFAHPNQLAAFLIVACATTIILLLLNNYTRINRVFYSLTLIFVVIGEVLTFSRAGWLATILSIIIIFIISRATIGKEAIYRKTAIISIAAIILGVVIAAPFIGPRLTITDSSTINRIYYDRLGLQIFTKNPILGAGLGQIMPSVEKLGNFSETWQIQPPHNYFIIVACETGLVGLIVILCIFGILLWRLWKNLRTGDRQEILFKTFLFASFISFLLLMQFDHYFYTLQQTQLLLWSGLGIINAAVYTS